MASTTRVSFLSTLKESLLPLNGAKLLLRADQLMVWSAKFNSKTAVSFRQKATFSAKPITGKGDAVIWTVSYLIQPKSVLVTFITISTSSVTTYSNDLLFSIIKSPFPLYQSTFSPTVLTSMLKVSLAQISRSAPREISSQTTNSNSFENAPPTLLWSMACTL